MDADVKYVIIVNLLIFLVSAGAIVALIMLLWSYASRKKSRQLAEIIFRFRKARDEAKNVDNMKTAFVNSITHEIRTPLNGIVGFGEMLLQEGDSLSSEEKAELSTQIEDNTKRLTTLIDDLVSLSSVGAGDIQLHWEAVGITDLLEAAAAHANPLPSVAVRKECQVNSNIKITTDREKALRILYGLVDNASKFTEQGIIEITCEYSNNPDTIIFAVSDTGPGIPKDKMNEIFKRFTKLDEFKQGNGLGLYVGRRFSRLLGGVLDIDRNYTGGSRFYLELPLTRKV